MNEMYSLIFANVCFSLFQPGEHSTLAAGKISAPAQPAKPKTDVVNDTDANKIQICFTKCLESKNGSSTL